ncbi:unnamed protein product [Caenorhabditis auriculariae]|uniref:C2H2-type domain-containing protein n=1 Tax=Caenorhabditis auriculariae TaxID=2777116 RepID=A0A8S1H705_9PELO|nr:unnamed protein product [Caenorhabditis auriculariae]
MGSFVSIEAAGPLLPEISRLFRELTVTNIEAQKLGEITFSVPYVSEEHFTAMQPCWEIAESMKNLTPQKMMAACGVLENVLVYEEALLGILSEPFLVERAPEPYGQEVQTTPQVVLERFFCAPCRRDFPTARGLMAHFKLSDTHKMFQEKAQARNLQILQRSATETQPSTPKTSKFHAQFRNPLKTVPATLSSPNNSTFARRWCQSHSYICRKYEKVRDLIRQNPRRSMRKLAEKMKMSSTGARKVVTSKLRRIHGLGCNHATNKILLIFVLQNFEVNAYNYKEHVLQRGLLPLAR